MVRMSAPPSCMAVAIEWRKMWQAPDFFTPDCLMYRLAYSVSESGCSGLPSLVRNSVCSLGSDPLQKGTAFVKEFESAIRARFKVAVRGSVETNWKG
jgi:hypothetical protein